MNHESTLPDDWRGQLTQAFEIVLGAPLATYPPDADYATYVGGNVFDEFGYDSDPAWVRPAALSGAEPVVLDCGLFDQGEPPSRFDAARSFFEFDDLDAAPDQGFAADLAEVAIAPGLVRGADLAPLVARHGIDLTDEAWSGQWYVAYPRLASDGTLFDAMRTALTLGDGPESVLPLKAEATEQWTRALEAVTHPGLRAHLSYYCTNGSQGLIHLGANQGSDETLVAKGSTVVATWQEGQSQVEFTVIQLSDEVARPA
ncbi:hypothetical protein V5P93_002198 [Actinokineospora auranticolor]|uniref:Uncharacterized protein n=1 Tax=Actinokineospora auranticolor TaxID=155976 RepID=A0A2S6GES6_9PSEU|nr:hypothetical protein [Actinokineospora auranticolor]PPK63714.1 hypothetical protein CLV40_12549 [Actinokineospora auranticolor]